MGDELSDQTVQIDTYDYSNLGESKESYLS